MGSIVDRLSYELEKKSREKARRKRVLKISFWLLLIVFCFTVFLNSGGSKKDREAGWESREIAARDNDLHDDTDTADDSALDVEDESAGEAAGESAKETADELSESAEDPEIDENAENPAEVEGTLEVHFIDVGQGDATLLSCNGHNLLIDAGDGSKGTTVQLYLTKHGVKSLDAVIWTHPDADHIGGADVIVTKYDIGTVYQSQKDADTMEYAELMDAMSYRGYKPIVPKPSDSFMLGDAEVLFIGPWRSFDNDNDNSLMCLVQFGGTRFLLTGDAEESAEIDIVDLGIEFTVDVYKAGHHGSRTSSTEELLNLVKPEYAVISCSDDNSYGHPHAEVLSRFKDKNIKVFRTDEQGSIVAVSDGSKITWSTTPSESWKPGAANGASNEASSESDKNKSDDSSKNSGGNYGYGTAPEGAVYIGNARNMKLHKASCSGLPHSHNQVLFDTLDEAKAAGYLQENQCKICKPYTTSKRHDYEMPDCDDYEDFDDFMDDWDGNMPDGSDAEDYWEDW